MQFAKHRNFVVQVSPISTYIEWVDEHKLKFKSIVIKRRHIPTELQVLRTNAWNNTDIKDRGVNLSDIMDVELL